VIGDVWSYGVVLWEIFSYGQIPYTGMTNDEVVEKVVMGFRLCKPADTPESVYSMMLRCWSSSRPSFKSMAHALAFWIYGGDINRIPSLDLAQEPNMAMTTDGYCRRRYSLLHRGAEAMDNCGQSCTGDHGPSSSMNGGSLPVEQWRPLAAPPMTSLQPLFIRTELRDQANDDDSVPTKVSANANISVANATEV
jgi:hypothetical protein